MLAFTTKARSFARNKGLPVSQPKVGSISSVKGGAA
jgi:hypothetical protein